MKFSKEFYLSHIKSDKWRDIRLGMLNHVGNACEACANTRTLQVHHLTYKHLGNEPRDDLIVLCVRCHRITHNVYWKRLKRFKKVEDQRYYTIYFLRNDKNKKAIKEVVIPVRKERRNGKPRKPRQLRSLSRIFAKKLNDLNL